MLRGIWRWLWWGGGGSRGGTVRASLSISPLVSGSLTVTVTSGDLTLTPSAGILTVE